MYQKSVVIRRKLDRGIRYVNLTIFMRHLLVYLKHVIQKELLLCLIVIQIT